jgi:hypothetical protein
VGFATGSKNKGKDGPSDSEFLFGEAFVHPDHRRKGIADATETFLSRIVVSSGSSTAYTIVEEENTGSQARMNRSGRGGWIKGALVSKKRLFHRLPKKSGNTGTRT